MALHVAAGKMYWPDQGTGKIQRANLNGTSIEDVVTGLNTVDGIALDLVAGKLYWGDQGDRQDSTREPRRVGDRRRPDDGD